MNNASSRSLLRDRAGHLASDHGRLGLEDRKPRDGVLAHVVHRVADRLVPVGVHHRHSAREHRIADKWGH